MVLVDCDASGLQLAGTVIEGVCLLGTSLLALGCETVWPEKVRVKSLGFFWGDSTLDRQSLSEFCPVSRQGMQRVCRSQASGWSLDGALIRSFLCHKTDLGAVSGRNLRIAGRCEWDECVLDGLRLTDYVIEATGELIIRSKTDALSSTVKNATIWTEQANAGSLVVSHVTFSNCRFGRPGSPSLFSPSRVEAVHFDGCDFAGCQISPARRRISASASPPPCASAGLARARRSTAPVCQAAQSAGRTGAGRPRSARVARPIRSSPVSASAAAAAPSGRPRRPAASSAGSASR